MKSLYNRKGTRRPDGEKHSFAFFATGALAVLAAMFLIGLQVGRMIEKSAAKKEIAGGKAGGEIVVGQEGAAEISREIGAFSAEAEKLRSAPAPSPEERVRETERSVTFRETLERKNPGPAALSGRSSVRAEKESAPQPDGGRLYVQAAAFRDRQAAERMRLRLARAGYRATSVAGGRQGADLHRVLVGPYAEKKAASRAMARIAAEFRVKAFLVGN